MGKETIRGNGSPVFDMMGAIYVVRQVTTDTPIEANDQATTEIRYRYGKARMQTGGRGFLGFEQVFTETPVKSASDSEAKILETTITYRQDFPFNGLPASTVVKQLGADFYDTANLPPVCDNSSDCLPEPCIPGEVCYDPQRIGVSEILLSEVINTPASTNPTAKSHFAYIESSETRTYSPEDGTILKTITQTSSHDDYGNPLTTTTTVKNAAGSTLQTNTITNTYDNITTPNAGQSRWHIGLLKTSTVIKSRTEQPTVTTQMAYDYNSLTGLLTEERHHSDEQGTPNSDLFLRVQYQYDQYGNNTKVRSCSNHLSQSQCKNEQFTAPNTANPYHVNRYNRLTFDPKGRYIKATYNTLEQKISDVTARDIYGNPTATSDLIGRTTTNNYDTFGRLTSSRNAIGEWSQTSRQWCSDLTGNLACPANRAESIRIRTLTSGGGESYTYLDQLGREIASTSRTFNVIDDQNTAGDERYTHNQVWFDNLGRQVKSEGPYFLGSNTNDKPISHVQYDRYARPTMMTLADNSTQEIHYQGLTTTYTNAKGQRKIENKNALGQLIEVKDFDQVGSNPNYQNTLNYSYNSQGLVSEIKRTTTQNNLQVTELLTQSLYDKAGRKYSFHDVDTGGTLSYFNAEGEVIETQDAKGQILKNHYDNLGRVYQSESYQDTTKLTTTINTYNPSNGLTTQSQRFLGNENLPDYSETHQYDAHNRPTATITSIKDTVCGGFNCNYSSRIYYDQYSRIKYQQDASTKAIQNHYNAQGYLNRITDTATDKEYYRINSTDKWGNITQDVRGDHIDMRTDYTYNSNRGWIFSIDSTHQSQVYEFDTLGNLGKRADLDHNQSECFSYDRLNRLTDTYRYNNFAQACANTGDNVEHQQISYDGRGNITNKDNQTYTYNTALSNTIGTSPHQVQSKGLQTFTYDANGNNTQTTNFTNQSGFTTTRNIEYDAFDKITRIYTGNSQNPYEESLYRYDTSEQKFARIDKNNQGDQTTTHFIGNVEIEYNTNGQIAHKRQLGNYAILTETNGATQETYLFTDHLGSIDVITDKNGKLLQSMNFSAWGERRLPHNWGTIPTTDVRNYLSDYTTRGFTGHEMLDAFGIINMGGRIYDAALGRVLQADPFIQEPTSSQSHNRYSYVFNNPLSYTDPSGFITLRQAIGIVVGIALAYFLGPLVTKLWHALLVGFASGFVSGAIITGSLKGALKSGLIGAAVAGVMFQITGPPGQAADPKAADAGGAGDAVSGNSFDNANAVAETTTTATTEAVETVVEQGGNMVSPSIGSQVDPSSVNLSPIKVIGNPVAEGATLSQVRQLALITSNLAPLMADMADALSESFANDLSRDVLNSFRQTYNDLESIYNDVRGIIGGRMQAINGAITGISIASMATPIGWARGAVGRLFFGKTINHGTFGQKFAGSVGL